MNITAASDNSYVDIDSKRRRLNNGLQGPQQQQLKSNWIPRRLIHHPLSSRSFHATKCREPCKFVFTRKGCMRGSSCRFSHDPGDQLCEVITDVTPTNQYAWTIQGAPRDSWIIQRAPRTIQRAQPLATNPPPQQQHPQIHPRAVTNPQQHRGDTTSVCSSPCCASSIVDSEMTAHGSSPLAVANSITSGSDDRSSESSCTSNFQPPRGGDGEDSERGGGGYDEDQSSRVENESIYGYEQVLDLDSCAKTISSLVRKGATTREILQKFDHLPDGEEKLMRVLLKSLALFNKNEKIWNIKTGKKASLEEVQDGIVAIWNATLNIPGTTYPQASDNCYSWMKIHDVPVESMDALFNGTVISIYENKMATYSKHELYHLKRRKPWEGMTYFSKLTAV